MNDKIIVIDELTHGILCESISISIAHSVSLGFINSSVKILASSLPWLENNYNYNYNDIGQHYEFKKMKILPLKENLINDEYLNIKRLAILRNSYHRSWETKCKQHLQNRNHDYHGLSMLGGYLNIQLEQCKPQLNFYTSAIHEWAIISEVPVATAYQELRIKSDTIGIQYLQNHAIYQKYVNLLNKCLHKTELEDVILEGLDLLSVGRSLI
jgi:hypothetical protein